MQILERTVFENTHKNSNNNVVKYADNLLFKQKVSSLGRPILARFIFILLLGFWSQVALAQKARIIYVQDLQKLMADPSDSLTVINFWATWCKPCVAELPHFLQSEQTWKGKKVRFWYVSLDFAEQKKTRLDPFIQKRKMKSKVFVLDEVDYNTWLPLVDKDWQGSIPVTLFVNNSKNQRKFVDGELSLDKLNEWISNFLKN